MDEEKVNILVVDDLEDKLLVYEMVLAGLGQNLIKARSGREALRHLLDKEFAVILLDVKMPDMDGLETAAMIRSRRQTAQTPIIFVTAYNDDLHTAQGYSLGAVDYIMTPIVPEILRTKVGVFVDLYKKTQQVRRQAQEHVALARAQAARAAAEEATRRSAFLADATTALSRSLDHQAIARTLAARSVPFLADLCAVVLAAEGLPACWRTELAWIDPADGSSLRATSLSGSAELGPLAEPIRRVTAGADWEVLRIEPPRTPDPTSTIEPVEPASFDIPAIEEACIVPGTGIAPHTILVVPLNTHDPAPGVLALAIQGDRRPYEPEQIGLARDLAGRAAIALDNARLYRNVQENNRRKNEFLAMLAHELRNPLAPIRNAVEILRMLDIPDQNLHWANDIINRQVEQLVRLVDDLLDISRITGGKIQLRMETIDVALAVTRAVETSRPLIDARRHTLSISLPSNPLIVSADLVRLSQVLSNLLNNAAKYTEEGGQIELEVRRDGPDVVFLVRDNGIGITGDMVPSIFDLFTQVDRTIDRSQGGLGVGLTLVRQLVEMHGGSVNVHSEGPNRGSEFVVRLPILNGAAKPEHPTEPGSSPDGPATPRRILIIEDYPAVAESLRRMLHLGGHEVKVARDGDEALQTLVVEETDVVLLDIGLPGMDGYDVARSIRRRPRGDSIVLVALTGHGQEEDRRRSREAGFDHHLTKPVEPAALFSLLTRLPPREAGNPALTPILYSA